MRAVTTNDNERVLRVGLIESGQLREERIARDRSDVSFGRGETCTFVTASDAAPMEFTLFAREGNTYRLHFTDAMDGRLARPDGIATLHALRDSGHARRESRGWSIALDVHARGKIALDDTTTVLFQFVPAPPPAPRPQLPSAIRSRPLARTDWTYNACLAGFLFAAFAGVSYVEYGYDPVVEDDVAESFNVVRLVLPPTVEPATPPEARDDAPAPTDHEAMADRPAEPGHDAPHAPTDTHTARPTRPERQSDEEAAASAIRSATRAGDAAINAFAHSSEFAPLVGMQTGAGGVADRLAMGSVMNGTAADLANATGIDNVASGIHRGSLVANNAPGRSDQLGRGSRVHSDGNTIDTGNTSQIVVRVPTGRVTADPPSEPDGPGEVPMDEVARVVRRGLGGLQWCYTRGLQDHPSLAGRVEVQFSIGGSGRIVGTPGVHGFDEAPDVQQCLRTRFRSLVFPVPSGGAVDVSFPFHFSPGT